MQSTGSRSTPASTRRTVTRTSEMDAEFVSVVLTIVRVPPLSDDGQLRIPVVDVFVKGMHATRGRIFCRSVTMELKAAIPRSGRIMATPRDRIACSTLSDEETIPMDAHAPHWIESASMPLLMATAVIDSMTAFMAPYVELPAG